MEKINKKELKELFGEIKHDNKVAFEKLYNKYNRLVYGVAFSMLKSKQDAEDIVQTVFTKIYVIDKSKLPSSNEATWLYSVTKNETINFLKKKSSNLNLESIYEIEDANNEINKIIDQDSYNRLIRKLNDKEKEIVSLKILGNFSFDEIGKILNTPTGTIKWKYYKSINTLKILLGNLGMFIVSFVSSIITFKSDKKTSNLEKEEINDIENGNLREDEEIKGDSTENKGQFDNNFLHKEDQTQENVSVDVPVQNSNINYIGICFMGISLLFLLITINFFIIFVKRQLKGRKNCLNNRK